MEVVGQEMREERSVCLTPVQSDGPPLSRRVESNRRRCGEVVRPSVYEGRIAARVVGATTKDTLVQVVRDLAAEW